MSSAKLPFLRSTHSSPMSSKILAWNCHSLTNQKKVELSSFLYHNNHDIILLSETWLSKEKEFSLPDFDCYRADRAYGGVAILIKKKIPHRELTITQLDYAEAISCKVLSGQEQFTITSIYCSPSASRKQANDFFNKILSIPGRTIIAGDFNAHHSAWNNIKNTRKGIDLFNLCNIKNFNIHGPDGPTCIPPNGTPAAIDFAISKQIPGISAPKALNEMSSDHLPISFSVPLNFTSIPIKIFNYRKADWKSLRNSILADSISLDAMPQNSPADIDLCIESVTSSIHKAMNRAIP